MRTVHYIYHNNNGTFHTSDYTVATADGGRIRKTVLLKRDLTSDAEALYKAVRRAKLKEKRGKGF